MSQILRIHILLFVVFITGTQADAFSLKKALKDVGNIVKQAPNVVKSIPSPLNTQIDIITGKTKPKDILKNEGQRLQDLSQHVREIDNTVQNNVSDLADAVGGDFGRVVVEVATGAQKYQKEFLLTSTNTAGLLLQGQDPLLAVATPLAAAIRDAHNKYDAVAQPLPVEFRQIFAPFIPANILNRARYSVDNLKISLPSLINSGQKMFGSDHAVVVDDIIVFSKRPDPNSSADIFWVAHEVHHVYQYANWGVDQFALNYMRNYGRVEAEADQAATTVHAMVMQAGGGAVASFGQASMQSLLASPMSINTPLGPTQVVMPGMGGAPSFKSTITDTCIVQGEQVVLLANNSILSPMRFNQVVGQRVPPSVNGCAFEMLSTYSRYCVSIPTGVVYSTSVPFPVGQCKQCINGQC